MLTLMARRIARLALVGAAFAAAPAGAQKTSACRPADATSAQLIASVSRYMQVPPNSTVAPYVAARDSLRLLPVSPSALTVVTDIRVCQKLADAYAAKLNGAGSGLSGSVYVVQAGPSRYVVLDPFYQYAPPAHVPVYMVFTDRYAWLSTFSQM
ncbi:MAG: hypothetical protein ACJ79S_22415 [Gemmatimonadaceae bacterium]